MDLATKAIEEAKKALSGLPIKTDKDDLKKALDKGEKARDLNIPRDLEDELERALNNGKTILNNPNTTQDQINEAIRNIDRILRKIEEYLMADNFTIPNWLIFGPTESNVPTVETKLVIKYINGYEDNTFRPEGEITRGEAAAMYARLLTNNNVPSGQNFFNDVKTTDWYNDVISFVVNKGYTKGYERENFRPEDPITRGEFAQMIVTSLKGTSTKSDFSDIEENSAKEAIELAAQNGIILGYGDKTFRPNDTITRAEAVTMLNRMFERTTTPDDLTNVSENSIKKFNDVSGHWAEYDIIDASNTREQNSKNSDWIEVK